MNADCFVDTNLLLYLYSQDDLEKKKKVLALLQQGSARISTQVVIEFTNVLHRKFKISSPKIEEALIEIENSFTIHTNNLTTIKKAIKIMDSYRYSWFDSLIIASAIETECSILYTEDMQHQHVIENSISIINPFFL